jgi:hypothetical protein
MHGLYFYRSLKSFVFTKCAPVSANKRIDQFGITFGDSIISRNCFASELRCQEQMR